MSLNLFPLYTFLEMLPLILLSPPCSMVCLIFFSLHPVTTSTMMTGRNSFCSYEETIFRQIVGYAKEAFSISNKFCLESLCKSLVLRPTHNGLRSIVVCHSRLSGIFLREGSQTDPRRSEDKSRHDKKTTEDLK